MKKYIFIPALIVSIVVIIIISFSIFLIYILGSSGSPEEVKIMTSSSPNNSITLEAYQVNGGATVDYSIKVYLINENKKELIYNAYHESEVIIEWLNNEEVVINNIKLDISKGEKYDWRKQR